MTVCVWSVYSPLFLNGLCSTPSWIYQWLVFSSWFFSLYVAECMTTLHFKQWHTFFKISLTWLFISKYFIWPILFLKLYILLFLPDQLHHNCVMINISEIIFLHTNCRVFLLFGNRANFEINVHTHTHTMKMLTDWWFFGILNTLFNSLIYTDIVR